MTLNLKERRAVIREFSYP